jgi:hypothetical protein
VNRDTLLFESKETTIKLGKSTLNITRIIYWTCITIALLAYQFAEPYYRPPIFFVSISIAVSLLGLEILSLDGQNYFLTCCLILKIFITSLIVRFTAYFISSYPIGSDPWAHAEIIKDFSTFGTSNFHQIHECYSNYPLMHIFTFISSILGNLSTKESMAIIGTILVFSTIFVYLISKKITKNSNIALLSFLLINFSDFHIMWSVQVIAMTFGIAIYTIGIYLLVEQKHNNDIIYKLILILFIFVVVWTHTVSSLILMVSIISLYIGSVIYKKIYNIKKHNDVFMVNGTLCILFITILIYHWIDPHFPFLQQITIGLVNSFSSEAKFLGRAVVSNIGDSWESIWDIFGFLMLIFFGIIGCLCNLSIIKRSKTTFSLIFMITILFFIFFIFPVLGLKDIVPYRWPAFIYVTLVLFAGIGLFQFTNSNRDKYYMPACILILLLTLSFSMITSSMTNTDSPICGKELNQRLIWTESEINLFTTLNSSYEGYIVTDLQTSDRLFMTFLKRDEVTCYQVSKEGYINWNFLEDKMIIWRKISLTRPVQVQAHRHPNMLLGTSFKIDLDRKYSNVYDIGEAEAYLNL